MLRIQHRHRPKSSRYLHLYSNAHESAGPAPSTWIQASNHQPPFRPFICSFSAQAQHENTTKMTFQFTMMTFQFTTQSNKSRISAPFISELARISICYSTGISISPEASSHSRVRDIFLHGIWSRVGLHAKNQTLAVVCPRNQPKMVTETSMHVWRPF